MSEIPRFIFIKYRPRLLNVSSSFSAFDVSAFVSALAVIHWTAMAPLTCFIDLWLSPIKACVCLRRDEAQSPARGASSWPLEDRGIIWLRVPPSTLFVVNSSSLQAAGHEASCHGSMARLRLFVMRLNCRKSVPQEALLS